MKKRVVSFSLIIVLVLTLVVIRPFAMKDNIVKAEEYRNGFSLIPNKLDKTGIDTKTNFILKSKETITVEEIQNEFKIYPETEFKIEQNGEDFLIIPSKELEKNKLYTFNFKDASWAFQTMASFKILGTLPNNETTMVPTNTGIEIYFSHSGVNLKDYFEISPNVKGSFENHGNVVVFVPKALEEKTIYTVRIKAGLSLPES